MTLKVEEKIGTASAPREVAVEADTATGLDAVECCCGSTLHTEDQHLEWMLRDFTQEEQAREQDRRTAAVVRRVLRDELAAHPAAHPAPALIDAPEAARLLNISTEALYQRRQRHQLPPGSVVQIGERRVQFRADKLVGGRGR